MEVDKRATAVVAFSFWTVTSFGCHWAAKRYLKTSIGDPVGSNHALDFAVALTAIQCLTCFIIVDLPYSGEQLRKKVYNVKIISHILATFCTNYSMTFMNAASTFTIKLLEPVTSALIQSIFQKILPSIPSIISLPFIIYGAIVFTSTDTAQSMVSHGALLAFTSNIILAFRNVAISKEHKEKLDTNLRNLKVIVPGVSMLCVIIFYGHNSVFSETNLGKWLTIYLMTTGVLHVAYSYISTNIMLKLMTVFNHSVLNIFKRLLVVLLLYVVGSRKATLNNWFGLGLCTVGLFLNLYGKYRATKEASSSSFDTRINISNAFGSKGWIFGGMISIFIVLSMYSSNVKFNQIVTFQEKTREIEKIANFTKPELLQVPEMLQVYDVSKDIEKMKEFGRQLDPNLKTELTSKSIVYQLFNFNKDLEYQPLPVSASLTNRDDIISYAQNYQYTLFEELLRPYEYVILLDAAIHENKGDPAITVGEFYLLQRLQKILLYYCNFEVCTDDNLKYGHSLAEKFTSKKVAILFHGGGNIMGWVINDKLRSKIFKLFQGYSFFLFPQSVFLTNDTKHLKYCEDLYRNQANFTMVLRDLNSYKLAKKHFSGKPTLLMAPDMAFQIGPLTRFVKPFYDILWIRRTDKEKIIEKEPVIPDGITVKIADWLGWPTPKSKINMERAYLIVNNGLVFLQRGKVVITDRLHGHILSTLLDIPHVVINNKWNKVGNYHNTWTKSHSKTRVADNSTHAIALATQLLHEYHHILPHKVPYMEVRDINPFTTKNPGKV